jgi:hypothetical protein
MTSDPDASEDDHSNSPIFTMEETQYLLDLLLTHKKESVQEALGQPHARTKAELRAWLQQGIDEGVLSDAALLALLQRIEGWGDQHVTLYRAPASLSARWMDKKFVVSNLQRQGIEQYLHADRVGLRPQGQLDLSSITWTADHLRMVWLSDLLHEERIHECDRREGDIALRAYRVSVSRRLAAFDWNLVSGDSMLMIQRMPSVKDYAKIRELVRQQLDPMIPFDQFTLVRVSRAIRRIERSGAVRCRQVSYLTARGDRLVYMSADRNHTLVIDPDKERNRGSLAGLMGDFYWPHTAGLPSTEVHFKIHGADQSVVFFGQYAEKDVRYVLSRIRRYSKTSS